MSIKLVKTVGITVESRQKLWNRSLQRVWKLEIMYIRSIKIIM